MDARLLQEPNGYQLLRELEKLKQTDCRSIAKLMEWVVTGAPAGLFGRGCRTRRLHRQRQRSLMEHSLSMGLSTAWFSQACGSSLRWYACVCYKHANTSLSYLCASAGEREAARQPAGLNVPLHPYQLQSLAFMQEAEKLEGGWRQLLWRWLPSQPQQQQQQQGPASSSVGVRGQGMWWSPVLDRLSFSVPPAPWGGFLGEWLAGVSIQTDSLRSQCCSQWLVIAGTERKTDS
jgi:hypothetical protein